MEVSGSISEGMDLDGRLASLVEWARVPRYKQPTITLALRRLVNAWIVAEPQDRDLALRRVSREIGSAADAIWGEDESVLHHAGRVLFGRMQKAARKGIARFKNKAASRKKKAKRRSGKKRKR